MTIDSATFGAGCFWCLEAAMNQLQGVTSALSGYMGGDADSANYHRVCDGDTGHAEVVQDFIVQPFGVILKRHGVDAGRV